MKLNPAEFTFKGFEERGGQTGAVLEYPSATRFTPGADGISQTTESRQEFCTAEMLAAKMAVAKASDKDSSKLEQLWGHLETHVGLQSKPDRDGPQAAPVMGPGAHA